MIAAPMRLLVLAGLVSAGCAPAMGARPRLSALMPDSVQLTSGNVTEVTLKGAGFDTNTTASLNTVRVGGLVLTGVPSRERGTVILLALPDAVPSGGEAPPAPWMSGRYAVTVTTSAGTSDTLMLVITGGAMRP